MKRYYILLICLTLSLSYANESKSKIDQKEHTENNLKPEHDDHDKHDDHEKSEEAEANKSVGTEKGIIEASEKLGFKLSPEAIKRIGFKTIKFTPTFPCKISIDSILESKNEVNIYRIREGYIKRIDFEKIRTINNFIEIKSNELKIDDEIILDKIGFIRLAELAAYGGNENGHSH